MCDRAELLESALDCLPEGVALTDAQNCVTLWNTAAERITGYSRAEIVGRQMREALAAVVVGGTRQWKRQAIRDRGIAGGTSLRVAHKAGCEIQVIVRTLNLRDAFGGELGAGAIFHATHDVDALPDYEFSDGTGFGRNSDELRDRLAIVHEEFLRGNTQFGVLWISVDQAAGLRRTHGARAVQAMLENVERTLASGLRPGEEVGRWSDDDFLVLSRERNAALLSAHGELLAGVGRTTDFRWWGDRISITLSIGAAQAQPGEPLTALLEQALAAMAESARAGGNRVTKARRLN